MDLQPNEIRDITRLLEQGKPLPDKYRFLLFGDKRQVELVWNGKTDDVTNVVLPFQSIEHIDEPRTEAEIAKAQQSLLDTSGQQIKGWTNKLIWGDNKLILSALKNGPMRKEIEDAGGIKLIYIDSPFDVGADFSMNIEIGDDEFTKKPSVIEEIAYRDTWGKGADSFIAMIYERLELMHSLLSEDGSIFVHCDSRVSSYLKLILDEIFNKNNFRNEISWLRTTAGKTVYSNLPLNTDYIYWYTKSDKFTYNPVTKELDDSDVASFNLDDNDGRGKYNTQPIINPAYRQNLIYIYEDLRGQKWQPPAKGWRFNKDRMRNLEIDNRLHFTKNSIREKYYLLERQEKGKQLSNNWFDIPGNSVKQSGEGLDYPTQKPESLLERIIQMSSIGGDLVADFFMGSGTTLAVAEKLGRKWIGTDLGRFGVHTSRKRLIEVQRQLKKDGNDYRAFEILNLGNYERKQFVNIVGDLRAVEKEKMLRRKEDDFKNLILSAYKAEPINGFRSFVGKKRDRLVAVGPIEYPISHTFIQTIIDECREKGITKADVLGFAYEMGIDFSDAKKFGVDLQFKIIPNEVFDKRAVERGQVKFFDVSFVEVKPIVKKNAVAIELTNFSVFYNQDDINQVEQELKSGSTKIVLENGNIIKLSKDNKN